MKFKYDYIIIGSGPAGVSVAFPLVEAGYSVLMLDGGKKGQLPPPNTSLLNLKDTDKNQWKWMIGDNINDISYNKNASPKLNVPSLKYVFDEYSEKNKIISENFLSLGSLSTGGLSNAWGCGVASLDKSECNAWPLKYEDLKKSYNIIAKRIGISGKNNDDMANYFGLDENAQDALPLDPLNHHIISKYQLKKEKYLKTNFRLGRARVAALSKKFDGRNPCDLSSNCLLGCNKKSLYTAIYDLEKLKKFSNFYHSPGFLVNSLFQISKYWEVRGLIAKTDKKFILSTKKVILAAGTLATTRLALQTLKIYTPTKLYSNPSAAFMLFLPKYLGAKRQGTFGLGQLSFRNKIDDNTRVFGSTFSTTGIPISNFANHLPINRRNGIKILANLLSSCLVGNVFLPSEFSNITTQLTNNNYLLVTGSKNQYQKVIMEKAKKDLKKSFLLSGAILLPASWKVGSQGSDAHYAGTFPMSKSYGDKNTKPNGELYAANGIFIVDGACLPNLTEKSHTLTIMANADRIGRSLANSKNSAIKQ